jgi:hypothetical protein
MMSEQIGGSVVERLTRIETKLNGICRDGVDQEQRIRSLEKTKWLAIGIALTVSALSSTAIAIMLN